jgi:prefoldin subunit 2
VKKTLTPMAEDRKCFRLIGGVLVERTVGEVRPVITQNLAQIEKLCMTLMEKLKAAEKDAEEFRILHNIVISKEGEAAANAAGQGEGERRGAGVLV